MRYAAILRRFGSSTIDATVCMIVFAFLSFGLNMAGAGAAEVGDLTDEEEVKAVRNEEIENDE
jgi:hypothetical protein